MSSTLALFPSPPKHTDLNLKQAQLSIITRGSGNARDLARPPSRSQTPIVGRMSLDTVSEERVVRPYLHARKRSSTPDLRSSAQAPTQRQQTMPALRSAMRSCTPLSTGSSVYSSRKSSSTVTDTPSSKHTSGSFRREDTETPITARTSTMTPASASERVLKSYFSPVSATTEKSLPLRSSVTSPASATSSRPPRTLSVRSNGTSKIEDTVPADAPPNRSMFPQYDMSKPLRQQKYYPPQGAATPVVEAPPAPVRKDSGIVLVPKSYECIPEAESEDMLTLWTASTRLGSCGGRKLRLALNKTTTPQHAYRVGRAGQDLFSVAIEAKDSQKKINVTKTSPGTEESSMLANMSFDKHSCETSIFPQQAAIDALTAASISPEAYSISRFNPIAKSRAVEALASEAVAEARQHYTSRLVRTARARDSVGTVSAHYELEHPTAGELVITVARSTPLSRIYTTQTPQVKVTIHHPTAWPEAIASGSLALVSLDFAHSSCVIDLPGLLALEADYMLDTAISAVFAAAVMESEDSVQPCMTFEAPPTQALKPVKRRKQKAAKKRSAGLWPLRKTEVREIDEGMEDMPGVAKGALAMIELSIHGAFWALEKGFKSLDERSKASSAA